MYLCRILTNESFPKIGDSFGKRDHTTVMHAFKKIETEIKEIEGFLDLAKSIKEDAKTTELLKALKVGFEEMEKMGAKRKALIFTESRRTQKYLFEYLSNNGYANKIVQFYGGNRLKRNELTP